MEGTLTWYFILPKNITNSYADLANAFIKAHIREYKVKKLTIDIFKILKGDEELLRDALIDLIERILLHQVPDNLAATGFAKDLNERSLKGIRRSNENI